MDDTFARAVEYLLLDEGGHRADDSGPGGDTWYGIDRAYNADMTPWPPSRAQAVERYHTRYWLPYRLDELPPAIAYAVFDGIVQHDKSAVRILQACVGATIDGRLGSRTLAACRAMPPDLLLQRFLASRARYYAHLGNFEKEGNGWLNRLFAIHARCLRWIAPSPSVPLP